MGLFDVFCDVVTLPVRIGVDAVKLPFKVMDGDDDLMENTVKGIRKIERDLEE